MPSPLHASGALQFAFEKATLEGKITIGALLILSLFSWTIIITKIRQLFIATKWSKRFLAAYASTRDPLDIRRQKTDFDGSPAFELYQRGAEELEYHLRENPVPVRGTARISTPSFEAVKVVLEEAAAAEAVALEKGMIVLSTAVAGGPFIGLLVAIPAMFAYNFMVTTVRGITQELDGFASRFANQIEHAYVDNRPLSEEIKVANEALSERILTAFGRHVPPNR
jgi:biopolymer transport protein TolQ